MRDIIAAYSGGNVDNMHIGALQIFLCPFHTKLGDVLRDRTAHMLFEKVDKTGIAVAGVGDQVVLNRNIGKIGLGELDQKIG